MTRAERSSICNAMKLIHADEDKGGSYEMGMDILASLVGLRTFSETTGDVKPISVFELMRRAPETAQSSAPQASRDATPADSGKGEGQ